MTGTLVKRLTLLLVVSPVLTRRVRVTVRLVAMAKQSRSPGLSVVT